MSSVLSALSAQCLAPNDFHPFNKGEGERERERKREIERKRKGNREGREIAI